MPLVLAPDRPAAAERERTPELRAAEFVAVARALTLEAAELGLAVGRLGFQSPPRDPTLRRSLRRSPRGVTVFVRRAGQSDSATVEDLVDGVLAAARVAAPQASAVRARLLGAAWAALGRHASAVASAAEAAAAEPWPPDADVRGLAA